MGILYKGIYIHRCICIHSIFTVFNFAGFVNGPTFRRRPAAGGFATHTTVLLRVIMPGRREGRKERGKGRNEGMKEGIPRKEGRTINKGRRKKDKERKE
jgi:hypothetical protein